MKKAFLRIRSVLQLIRLPVVPTAVADVLMAALLARHYLFSGPTDKIIYVVVASTFLYMAGLVLNDVAHVDRDLELHPDRPLPSGRVSTGTAFTIAGFMLLIAMISAFLVGPITAGIAATLVFGVILYDFDAATHPVWGPMLMGLLRTGNVLLGLSVAGAAMMSWKAGLGLSFFIGIHVLLITLISVLEETPESTFELKGYATFDVGLLVLFSLYLLLVRQGRPMSGKAAARLLPFWFSLPFAFLPLAGYLIWFFSGVNRALHEPSTKHVGKLVGIGVQGLILIDATIVAVLVGLSQAGALLLLFIPILIPRWRIFH